MEVQIVRQGRADILDLPAVPRKGDTVRLYETYTNNPYLTTVYDVVWDTSPFAGSGGVSVFVE